MSTKLSEKFPTMSRLGLGTVLFGMDYGLNRKKLGQDEAGTLLDACRDNKINLLDTARDYAESEKVIGSYLKDHDVSKDFFIATKLTYMTMLHIENKQRLRNRIKESIIKSCNALGVNKIPMLLLHQTDDFVVKSRDFWEVLKEFDGRYGSFGISVYDPEQAEVLLKLHGDLIDLIQAPYNIFDRRFERLAPFLKDTGTAFIARSIFLRGVIPAKNKDLGGELHEIQKFKNILSALSKKSGLSESEIAFLFVVGAEWVDHLLFGAASVGEILQNINALGRMSAFKKIQPQLADLDIEDDRLIDPRQWKTL